jgi:hypothetical protein
LPYISGLHLSRKVLGSIRGNNQAAAPGELKRSAENQIISQDWLVPASPPVPAATENNQDDDQYDEMISMMRSVV